MRRALSAIPIIFSIATLSYVGFCVNANHAFAESKEPRIESIEFEGVKSLTRTDLENSLEIDIADSIDQERILRTIGNIKSLYFRKGYRQVDVQYELKKASGVVSNDQGIILVFTIDERLPTRVLGFKFSAVSVDQGEKVRKWDSIRNTLGSVLDMKFGDVADQDALTVDRKALESYIVSQDYVGARVTNMKLVGAVPTQLQKETFPNSEWTTVEYEVDLGEKVTFGFRGNQVLTRSELIQVLDDQRVIGFGRRYLEDLVDKIKLKYSQLGFAQVEVETYTFENRKSDERHVTFVIKEGPRVRIRSLDFDGNFKFSSEQLREEFYRRASLVVQRNYYVESEVQSSADLLVEWMKSQGYLFSKLITISKTHIKKYNEVRLLIYLYEGDQTFIRNIKIVGNENVSESEIKALFEIQEGQPLNLFAFSEGIEKVKARYRASGFLGMKITNENSDDVVQYFQRSRMADVYLQISEGYKYRAGKITIEGLDKTEEYIAVRELRFAEGDILEENKITESESRLRRLGIFSTVQIKMRDDPSRPGFKIIKVVLGEGTPGIIAGGVGFRNDLGIRVFGEYGYSNLWGRNHSWSLTGVANRRIDDFRFIEYELKLGYIWPWFVIDEMTLRPELAQEKHQYRQFDASTTSFKAIFEKRLLEDINLTGFLTYSLERTRQFNTPSEIDNQTLRIGSLIPALQLDFRNHPLSPTKGFFASVSYEIAESFFGSQVNPFPVAYTKFQTRADQFFPLGRGIVWYLSFRTGFERNTADPNKPDGTKDPKIAIPLSKQFTLGGPGSLRGFAVQELNQQDLAIQGTLSFVNYRTQIDFPLAGKMMFGPFMDAGNLKVDTYSFGDLRYGVGFGLHYMTPVGPVNFDWGFKVDPQPHEDPSLFYFSVGVL